VSAERVERPCAAEDRAASRSALRDILAAVASGARVLIGLAVMAAAIVVAVLAGVGWPASRYMNGDFIVYWLAGQALLQARDPYDPPTWRALYEEIGSRGEIVAGLGFLYPLTTAVVALPFALLPVAVAAPAWFVSQGLSAVGGLAALGRQLFRQAPGRDLALLAVLALAIEPVFVTAGEGNIARFLPGVVSGGLALLVAGQPLAAGAVLSLAIVKPQLFLFFAPALVVSCASESRRRLFAGGLMMAGVLGVVSVVLQPSWIGEWLAQSRLVFGAYGETSLWGILGADRRAVGWAIVLCAAVAYFWWRHASRPSLPVAAAAALGLSVFVAPYAHEYDEAVLLAGVPVLLARIATLSRAARLGFIIVLVVTSPALVLLSAAGLIPPGPELLIPGPALCVLVVVADRIAPR